jgi:ectoine hydroxylase-related dioxygenase (phytanoyl-CoA dioxygenase family)
VETEQRHSSKLTPTECVHFWETGFLKIPHLLSSEDLTLLRCAMGRALQTLNQSPNSYNVTAAADAFWNDDAVSDQGSTQHDLAALATAIRTSNLPRLVDQKPDDAPRGNFLLDTSVWRRVPELAEFALRGKLAGVSAELLRASRVRYYDDQLFVKEPGAVDRAAFHQDVPYFHLDGDCGCVFWIPLNSVKAGGGRIGYIPGSHRWQKMFKANVFVSALPFPGAEGVDMPRIDADPEAYGAQYLEAEPGDVIVHHFLTVHGSEGNRSTSPRSAFSLRYCDANIRYRHRPGAPAQPLHKQGMKDGEALDDAIHPVVWPQIAGATGALHRVAA